MSTTKHSPPWDIPKGSNHVADSDGNIVCLSPIYAITDARVSIERWVQNAPLIVAAPELLAALKFCQSVISNGGMFERSEQIAYDKATEAIKKAEG